MASTGTGKTQEKTKSHSSYMSSNGHKTFLHIEDSCTDAFIVKRILKQYMPSASLVQVSTLCDAERTLSNGKNDISLILLDLELPDTSGRHETFSRIMGLVKDTPVVILTSLNDREMVVGLVNSGAENYIRKSVISSDPTVLCEAIDVALCHHNQQKNRIKEKEEVIEWLTGGYSCKKQ